MRKIAVVLSFAFFGLAGPAHAAAVSKTLRAAAQKSFQGLQNQMGKNNYLKSDRLQISSNGKTAGVSIQAYGSRPGGPVVLKTPTKSWYTIKNATFKKAESGTWSKSGRWNTLYFAL